MSICSRLRCCAAADPVLEVYLFALGLSLFLSAAFVKFRDISYIWEVILQAGFYMTPILYPLSLITNVTLQKLILLNPMAQAIQDARYAAVTHQTTTAYSIVRRRLVQVHSVCSRCHDARSRLGVFPKRIEILCGEYLMSDDIAIKVENVSKTFKLPHEKTTSIKSRS